MSVVTHNGSLVSFEDSFDMMDEELVKDLHYKLNATYSDQYFFTCYLEAHHKKFCGEFTEICFIEHIAHL